MRKKEEIQEKELKLQQADLNTEITSEITFLQEKIKERPVNKAKLVRRTALTAAMAMVFGLVACVTFLLLEPVINRIIYPEEKAEVVRFPEEEQEVNPEDMAADEEELQIIREEEAAESNPDGVAGEAGEEISPEEAAKALLLENYQEMYTVLGELRAEVEKSIVSVAAVTSDVNWLNDTLENTGVTSGLIVADNGRELLILAAYSALKDADSILVAFGAKKKEATLKEVDHATGLAVVAVPLQALDEREREKIAYAALGSSAGHSLVGRPVMAVGSPVGIGGSACYGIVTSQGAVLGLADSRYRLLTTDIYGSRNASGVLANMKGEIVGVLYNAYEGNDMLNGLCGIGISELKRTIEKLSNGEKMAYLGTRGVDIEAATYQEYGMPRGAYVTNVDMDSPAMQAGLQNGDIITKADGADIVSYSDFANLLMRSQVGQNMKLTVARQRQGEYQEMTLTVTLQEQPKK